MCVSHAYQSSYKLQIIVYDKSIALAVAPIICRGAHGKESTWLIRTSWCHHRLRLVLHTAAAATDLVFLARLARYHKLPSATRHLLFFLGHVRAIQYAQVR